MYSLIIGYFHVNKANNREKLKSFWFLFHTFISVDGSIHKYYNEYSSHENDVNSNHTGISQYVGIQ